MKQAAFSLFLLVCLCLTPLANAEMILEYRDGSKIIAIFQSDPSIGEKTSLKLVVKAGSNSAIAPTLIDVGVFNTETGYEAPPTRIWPELNEQRQVIPDHYLVSNIYFDQPGAWQIHLVLKMSNHLETQVISLNL